MRRWLLVALIGCDGGTGAIDAQLCAYGEPCNGACVNTATDPLNCGGCGNTCGAGASCQGQCNPTHSCLGIKTANPSAASGVYADTLIQGYSFFCDMRPNPPTELWDLIIVPKSDTTPTDHLVTAADLQDPVLQQAFLYFYNLRGATTPTASFDATDPCIADGATGSWLELGASRVFLGPRQGSQTTSFIASLPYALILADAASTVPRENLPSDFFATYPATSAAQAACSDGNNAALALVLASSD